METTRTENSESTDDIIILAIRNVIFGLNDGVVAFYGVALDIAFHYAIN